MLRSTILAALAALALTAAAIAAPDARVARAELGAYTTAHTGVVTDSTVIAHAHVVATPDGVTILRVTAEGLVPGGSYAVHVHYGACTDYLGHFQYEHPGPATRDNEVWLDLDANAAGRARSGRSHRSTRAVAVARHPPTPNPDTGPGVCPPDPDRLRQPELDR